LGGQGESRDRPYADQLKAASALTLFLASIVVWHTGHLQACLQRLREDGQAIEETDPRFLSPLLRRHSGI
jgi:TnpA family transposase